MTPQPEDPARDTIAELIVRVADGDTAAFDLLHDAVGPALFLIVLRVVRDRGHTQDVVQEVLLEIWGKAHRFQPERGTAMAWIATVAHHRAVDRVRTVRAAADRDLRSVRPDDQTSFDHVSEQVEHRLAHQRVRDCLRQLTDFQRQALVLTYYEGLSHQEIADLLRVPLGTAKSRVRDGLLRLRACMSEDT